MWPPAPPRWSCGDSLSSPRSCSQTSLRLGCGGGASRGTRAPGAGVRWAIGSAARHCAAQSRSATLRPGLCPLCTTSASAWPKPIACRVTSFSGRSVALGGRVESIRNLIPLPASVLETRRWKQVGIGKCGWRSLSLRLQSERARRDTLYRMLRFTKLFQMLGTALQSAHKLSAMPVPCVLYRPHSCVCVCRVPP